MLQAIEDADRLWLLAAFGCFVATHLIISLRWWLLLRNREIRISLAQVTWINFTSLFFALFLPTAAGGDFARVAYAVRRNVDLKNAVNSTLADRMIGLLTLSVITLLPALYLLGSSESLRGWSTIAIAIGSLSLLAIWQLPLLMRLVGLLGSMLAGRPAAVFARFADWLSDLVREIADRRVLWSILALSLLAHVVMIVGYWLVGKSVVEQAGLLHFFLFVPLIVLFTMIPIAINGLGLRELGFAVLFADVGMAEERAVAISLLVFAITLALGAFGGLLLTLERSGGSILRAE